MKQVQCGRRNWSVSLVPRSHRPGQQHHAVRLRHGKQPALDHGFERTHHAVCLQLARLGHADHVPINAGGVLRLRPGRQSALENRSQGQHDPVSLRRAVPANAEDLSRHHERGVRLRPGEQGAAGERSNGNLRLRLRQHGAADLDHGELHVRHWHLHEQLHLRCSLEPDVADGARRQHFDLRLRHAEPAE